MAKRYKKYPKYNTKTDRPRKYDPQSAEIFYILDEDPILAARSLISRHMKEYAIIISNSLTFRYLKKHTTLADRTLKEYYSLKPQPLVYQSPYAINYFSMMFEELERIRDAYIGRNYTYSDKFDTNLMLYNTELATGSKTLDHLELPSFLHRIKKQRKYFKQYNLVKGIFDKSNTIIDTYRIMYMVNGYNLNQFPCGAPPWYSPLKREVFRQYDPLSKKTFVIMTDENGIYKYYYQHISNKLREITDINELRELIDCLLFRS